MTDINVVIAKHKGWIPKPVGKSAFQWFQYDNNGQVVDSKITPPDYLNYARLYMALAVESRFSIIYDPDKKKYLAVKLRDFPYIDTVSIESEFSSEVDDYLWHSDIGTAICLAYCKLHGLE